MLLQEQLSQEHPGRLLEADQEKSWWFIRRQKEDQPTGWINESAGVIRHDEEIFDVYHVDIEEKVEVADHVKANDEAIVPGHLKKEETLEIKEPLCGSMQKLPLKTLLLAIMMASMLFARVSRSPGKELAVDTTTLDFNEAGDRRIARQILNEKAPRFILADHEPENEYAVVLARWQYRT